MINAVLFTKDGFIKTITLKEWLPMLKMPIHPDSARLTGQTATYKKRDHVQYYMLKSIVRNVDGKSAVYVEDQ